MGIDVERRGSPCVTESGGDDRNGHAGIEHLGGHEVKQVVKSEVIEPCSAPHPNKALGHEVRRPWPGARLVRAEDETILVAPLSPISRHRQIVPSQQFVTRCVQRNPIRTTCLRWYEQRTVGSLHQGALNAEASADQVHVDPTQGEELPPASSRCGRQGEIEVEGPVASHVLEKPCHLFWRGWPHLRRLISGRGCLIGDVLEDPEPALRLGQGGMERRVDT